MQMTYAPLRIVQCLLVSLILVWGQPASAQETLSLAGSWDFAMGDTPRYDDYVMLPGSMLTNGKGHPVSIDTRWTATLYDSSYYFNPYMAEYRHAGQLKFPFFLTPEHHYVGNAWYRRNVYVPQSWKKQRIVLFLERPHIETTVFVNGHEIGHEMSLSTPHVYDVSRAIRPGERNEIAIRVYNGIENVGVGPDSHSVTDQTQGNWNGIAGRIELQARDGYVNIRQVRVYPDAQSNTAHVEVSLENHASWGMSEHVVQAYEYNLEYDLEEMRGGQPTGARMHGFVGELEGQHMSFDINHLATWDEFSPVSYRLTVYAGNDSYQTVFGLRDIKISGRQFYINGRQLFIRGTVENCCFPATGYPPTDVDEWLRVMQQCKRYGINMIRFHSYCPPEAAFEAADRIGIYLQPEGPAWANHGVLLGRGMKIDQYLLDESKRIIDAYGNHPSFVMMAAGNEPAGDWVDYCRKWVRTMHSYDSTKVYCGASVGGGWAWDYGSEYHVKGGARGLDWNHRAPSSDDDYSDQIAFPRNYEGEAPSDQPILAHEQGQWCAFPDLSETSQYTGVYKPGNLDIFRDLLRRGGMESMAGRFLMASGRLQTLCYKYEIERNLRTPGYAGFQLLALNDYSGQGTAPVGPLNVHWREKGYVAPAQWREFCNSLVVLARFPRFVFSAADTLCVPVDAMNAFIGNLSNCVTTYEIWQNDTLLFAADTLAEGTVPLGRTRDIGIIRQPLSAVSQPSKMTLTVTMGNMVRNHWDFWVYPEVVDGLSSSEVFETDTLDARALEVLRGGGCVLITAAGRVTLGSDVVQTYLPVFWNTSWFKMRPPHTTGAYIDAAHPLFRYGFPTDDWANLNWWELLNHAQVMNLCELPADYQPPIQPIDTWHVSRKLGMLIEANVMGGRLLMTTIDIGSDLNHRFVARQLRHAIISYMLSPDFRPSLTLDAETIRHFFTRQAPPVNMFTKDSPDELKPKLN